MLICIVNISYRNNTVIILQYSVVKQLWYWASGCKIAGLYGFEPCQDHFMFPLVSSFIHIALFMVCNHEQDLGVNEISC